MWNQWYILTGREDRRWYKADFSGNRMIQVPGAVRRDTLLHISAGVHWLLINLGSKVNLHLEIPINSLYSWSLQHLYNR